MPVQAPKPVGTAGQTATAAELSPQQAPRRTRLALIFCAFTVAAALLFWRQLTIIADLWSSNGALSIGALVPLVSGWFGWRAWNEAEELDIKPATSGFFVALAAAMVIIASDLVSHAGITLSLVLIPLFLAGAMASAAGWHYVRRFTFPLAFLWFMLPVPPVLFGLMDQPLQLLCAKVVESVAHLLHMPVVRSGTIVGPNMNVAIDVAPECDGVRSAITLFTLSVLLSKIRRLKLSAAISLALIAIPLAYCANFMRLTGLFLMMYAFGEPFMRYEHYFDLTSGGVWFFAAVLVLAAIAQRLPRRTLHEAAA